jgi:prepilin-type N-terminal cleavage/methylation domain-containing protein
MMVRRGITLLELLVAMVLFAIVASLAMMVFTNQNRSFQMESERAEAALMAKGTLEELTHAVRMTGSNLPDSTAGIQVWDSVAQSTTFVMNEQAGIDTIKAFVYDPATRRLGVGISNAKRFSNLGFVLIPLTISPSTLARNYTIPIVERRTSLCGDSLILDASPLLPPLGNSVTTTTNSPLYNVDSLTYWKRNDTLFVRRNRQPTSTAFAVGVDTLKFQYWHPEVGWKPTLWTGTDPLLAKQIDKVNIRLVMRNLTYDAKRFKQDPNSRGYSFSVLETEVALRNTRLVNQ